MDIGSIVVLLIAVAGGTWAISNSISKMGEQINKKISDLDKDIGFMRKDINGLIVDIDGMKVEINKIPLMSRFIMGLSKFFDEGKHEGISSEMKAIHRLLEPHTQKESPIRITGRGNKLNKEERLEESIDNKWQEIKQIIKDGCIDMNPYDIQEFVFGKALTNLDLFLDKEGLERLKMRAYREGLMIEELSRIVGVIIRDKFFEEEGIDHEEIDKCDPN